MHNVRNQPVYAFTWTYSDSACRCSLTRNCCFPTLSPIFLWQMNAATGALNLRQAMGRS